MCVSIVHRNSRLDKREVIRKDEKEHLFNFQAFYHIAEMSKYIKTSKSGAWMLILWRKADVMHPE